MKMMISHFNATAVWKLLAIIGIASISSKATANIEGGNPDISCDFKVAQPNTDRSDATVRLELWQGNDIKRCYEEDQTYTLKIIVVSKDPNKDISGILIAPNKGKLDTLDGDIYEQSKYLYHPCNNDANSIGHTRPLYLKEIKLKYTTKSKKQLSLFFKTSVVFEYRDHMTVTEPTDDNSFPRCETAPTPTPTTPPPTIVPSPTPSPSPELPTEPVPVPFYNKTEIPPPACPTAEQKENVCIAERQVNRVHDYRPLIKDGVEYKCVSVSTLRFFTCGGCDVTSSTTSTCTGPDCTSTQYSCEPKIGSGTRLYSCEDDQGNQITHKFRNLTIQKGCTCCPTTQQPHEAVVARTR